MADIKVKWSAGIQSAEGLKSCKRSVDSIISRVSNVQNSSVFSQGGLSQYRRIIQSAREQLQHESEYLNAFRVSLDRIIDTYRQTEQNLSGKNQGIITIKKKKPKSSSKKDNSTTDSDQKVDWKQLFAELAGECGITGAVASGIYNIVTAGWKDDVFSGVLKTAKELSKLVGKLAKVVDDGGVKALWSKLWSPAEPYSTEYFWKTGATTAGKVKVIAKWAGTVLSAGIFGYENYKRVMNGEIKADDAVIATIASTVADTALDLGIGALAGTLGAAVGAPAIVVAGATIVVTWGVNEICKQLTGDDIAHVIGKKAIALKKTINANKIKQNISDIKNGVSALWRNKAGGFSLA